MVDYEDVIRTINKEVREYVTHQLGLTSKLVIMEQQSVKDQLAYPFGTYSISNPYLNVKNYESDVPDEGLKQTIEMVLSYIFYSEDSFTCMSIAQNALTCLELRGIKQRLWDKNIAIIDNANMGNRDNFITIQTERRYGFDLRIRIQSTSNAPLRDIIVVGLEDGSEIDK